MTLKSKSIEDYFAVALELLKPEVEVPFDIYLYFKQNEHLMLWRYNGTQITGDFLDKYRQKGMERVWLHHSDKAAFDLYLKGPQAAEEKPAPPSSAADEKANQEAARTGAIVAEALKSETLSQEQKQEVATAAATEMLEQVASAETIEDQKRMDEKAKAMVEAILAATPNSAQAMIDDLWNLPQIDPELEHSVTVATYTVILSMAFGRIDPEVLGDIALAGLLHDIGISQLPSQIAATPWSKFEPAALTTYQTHVEHTVRMIGFLAPQSSDRVREIVRQHHEKFDGSGYPQKLEGFNFDDIAQIVSMADLAVSIRFGQWDGAEHTMKEAFKIIESFEKAKNFPQYFNPEVFSRVINWVQSKEALDSTKTAQEVVEKQREIAIQ